MHELDQWLARNRRIAADDASTGTSKLTLPEALPLVKAIIIGCADMRVDPAHVLGLKPGEAVVLRNIGGRVTPGLLEQLGLLGRIGQVAGKIPGGGGEFHLIVLQHTDCGITRLVDDPALLTHYFQVAEPDLPSKSVPDPKQAVSADVAVLRQLPGLPAEWLLSGLVYDVHTGLIETVVPAEPIAA